MAMTPCPICYSKHEEEATLSSEKLKETLKDHPNEVNLFKIQKDFGILDISEDSKEEKDNNETKLILNVKGLKQDFKVELLPNEPFYQGFYGYYLFDVMHS